MLRHALTALSLSIACGPAWAALPDALSEAAIRQAAVASFPDYLAFLRLPNVSPDDTRGLAANALWLQAALDKRGFKVRRFEQQGTPVLVAERTPTAGQSTLLFYLHFDGQAVVPAQWAQASPFQPEVKRRDSAGKWHSVPEAELLRTDFDPELRVFARSAADDKGPIVMLLAALDLLDQQGIAPSVNVRLLLDGAEEVGSPGMTATVAEAGAALKADALVILDSPLHASGRPTAVFGNRGAQSVRLTVYGPRAPVHSGHYGNYVPNPALDLARLLAAMKDKDGRVTIPGYYARTRLTATERSALKDSNLDEAALRERLGVAGRDRVGANYMEALQYPSLNIRGMAAAGVGKDSANIIPKEAVAELDLRTTTEADGAYLNGLLRRFIASQGFTVLDREPTDAERRAHPKLIRYEAGAASAAARQSMDSPVRHWVERALTHAHAGAGGNAKPVLVRAIGGTVPTAEIAGPLGLPFVLVPLVNPDNNQHTYDENLRMGNYLSGIRSVLGLLTTPYPSGPGMPERRGGLPK